ncbi:dipeptidase 1-like protein [Phlyctochytrium arcticum]|nr:dipeptidase 1-like protein [Phlyctochytrium arcticum]
MAAVGSDIKKGGSVDKQAVLPGGHLSSHVSPKPGRRQLVWVLAGIFSLLLVAHWQRGCIRAASTTHQKKSQLAQNDYLGRAKQLLARTPVIDGHNDLPIKLQFYNDGKINGLNLTNLDKRYNTDMFRLREGRVGGQFWSAYIPCNVDFNKRGDEVRWTLEQIDLIHRIISSQSDTLEVAFNATDITRIEQLGRVASLIGIEGGHQIDNSLGALRQYYAQGVRYMTLTHVCHTAWADSCSPEPLHGGLTDFGRTVVKEMNRLGMMVDISHVSHATMRDVVASSRAPLFFSHSSVYALCPIQRNVPDEILRALTEKDGVIMINFYPRFVTCSANATLSDVADHVEYAAKIAGWDHVGIGSDFDGIDVVPTGLEDVSKYPYLFAELLRRGASEEQLEGLAGRNLLRTLSKTEQVALQIRSEGLLPIEDKLSVNKTC